METSRISRPSLRYRPAIIPNMMVNAGNRALSSQIWKALWMNYNRHHCPDKLAELAQMFLDSHPQRFNCISETLRHFNLVIGINADSELDYHQTIEDYFETGNGTTDFDNQPQTDVPEKASNLTGQDVRPVKQRQSATTVIDTFPITETPF